MREFFQCLISHMRKLFDGGCRRIEKHCLVFEHERILPTDYILLRDICLFVSGNVDFSFSILFPSLSLYQSPKKSEYGRNLTV